MKVITFITNIGGYGKGGFDGGFKGGGKGMRGKGKGGKGGEFRSRELGSPRGREGPRYQPRGREDYAGGARERDYEPQGREGSSLA